MSDLKTVEIPVHGMDCTECTQHVQKAIAMLPGVESVTVLLAAEKGQALEGVISMSAPIYIAEERGIAALPPREVCRGKFVPKARRRLRDVPPAVNHTYRFMPLEGVHEMLSLIERVKEVLPAIQIPALILHSLNDRTADAESAIYIRENLGSAQKRLVWLKSSGHLIPLGEERDIVFSESAAFIEALAGGGAEAD